MSNFYFVGSSERFELPIPGAQSRKIAVTAFGKTKLINQCVCQLPPTAPYKQDLFFKMFRCSTELSYSASFHAKVGLEPTTTPLKADNF